MPDDIFKIYKNIIVVAGLCLIIGLFVIMRDNGNKKYIGVEGLVIDKEYREAHNSFTTLWNGKVAVPIINHHPEKFIILVKYSTESGSERIEYSVTEEEYNSYKVGDIYIYLGE